MIDQISICTENKKGAARAIIAVLADNDINILSFVNGDSGEFGTMRLIVSDTQKAVSSLKEAGYLCKMDAVIGIELEDKPGAFEHLLARIERMYVNIGYMYVGFMRETNSPVILLHCEEMNIVEKQLAKEGFTIY